VVAAVVIQIVQTKRHHNLRIGTSTARSAISGDAKRIFLSAIMGAVFRVTKSQWMMVITAITLIKGINTTFKQAYSRLLCAVNELLVAT
jgi:hypothetical protein